MSNYYLKPITIVKMILGLESVLLLVLGSYSAGIRINTTKSIPVGFYRIIDAPIEKDAYVLWCPLETEVFDTAKKRGYIGSGFCPGNYGQMMKKILAAKNDTVSVTDNGVYVNGEWVLYSKPIQIDKSGRPLPNFRINDYTLIKNELLLMGDISPTSFDSRYFGLVDSAQIKGILKPIWLW